MTTMQPQPQQPRFATMADLEAFEGRIINRIAELEIRFTRDTNTAFWRMVALILPVYALVLAAILTMVVAWMNIASRLP